MYFNKAMSLLNKKLRKENVMIYLPHYWYRYGDQVHRSSMPSPLIWRHENPQNTRVDWGHKEKLLPTRGYPYDLIDQLISEIIEKYKDNDYAIVSEVYKYAPFEFQRKFLDVRKILHGRANAFNWDHESYQQVSEKIILNTLNSFPKKDFMQLSNSHELVYNFIQELQGQGKKTFRLIQKMCTSFWFLFCYHLRLHENARENIPNETVGHWYSELDIQNGRYRKIFADIILEAYEIFPDILKNDLIKDEYQWRISDRKEVKEIIDEFVGLFSDFNHSE